MIGAFENKLKKTGYPVLNMSDLNKIETLIVSDTSFVFDTEIDFQTQSQWINDIKSEYLAVFNGIIDVDTDHEETEYNKSILDYEYRKKRGKYRFTFKTVYEPEYHSYIESFSGAEFRIFLADVNGNICSNINGSNVRGLDVELFDVQKKGVGGIDPAWTIIRVVLSDPEELNLITKMDWDPNNFNLVHVALSNITGSGNYVDFTIKDSIFGISIDYLYATDLSLSDNDGARTITSLTELSCGRYRITANDSLTVGDIIVNSDRFYGSGSYVISQAEVIFNNFTYYSENEFQCDIRLSGDLSLYTGLVKADFTMVDDTNGNVVIASVTEVSTGRYKFITDTDLTTGGISVDDGSVNGAGEYDVQISISAAIINEFDGEPSSQFIELTVTDDITSSPVTGLVQGAFTITDTYGGAITISLFTDLGSGVYRIRSSSKPFNSGDVIISQGVYSGDGAYNNTWSYFVNCGKSDTTDWINQDVNGVPEFVSVTQPTSNIVDVVTVPPYFTGNVLRVTKSASTINAQITIKCSNFKLNQPYKLKFRFGVSGTTSINVVSVFLGGANTYVNDTIGYTPIPVTYYSDEFIVTSESFMALYIAWNLSGVTVNLDEVELIEV